MTKFNPKNKKKLTYEDTLGPAMKITDPEDAKQYFSAYVSFMQEALRKEGKDASDAVRIVKANLGYYAGYYDQETFNRVTQLFNCNHPVFGSNLPHTSLDAVKAGKKAAERSMA